MDFLIVIPARYRSTRFPGKPLVDINGKSMLERVYDKCIKASNKDKVIVATDDVRIVEHCKNNEIEVILTNKNCLTGTDRIYEVALKKKAVTYINVQGDEPLVSSGDIKKVIEESKIDKKIVINAMCKINNETDYRNYNIPKVITDNKKNLLYISRSPIPSNKINQFVKAMKQVCIYAYPRKSLLTFGKVNKKTRLESIEDIEILRFLEMGYDVKMVEVSNSSISVDTKKDLKKVLSIIND